MDDGELQSVLTAIIQGMIVADHSTEEAVQTLQVLSKVVSNALQGSDLKFRRLPVSNERVQRRILTVSGASEFLDAVGFVRENGGTGDFVLSGDDSKLAVALTALQDSLDALPKVQAAAVPKPASAAPSVAVSASSSTSDAEYEERKRAAEARQAEIRRKMEEEKRQREALRNKIKAEQREVRDRPVTASHAVHLTRSDARSGGDGDGKIRYTNSDREFQAVLSSSPAVIANFTASWCGPCQAIAPMVEDMARQNPHITFIKIDIDENNETPSRFGVSAVPTFILFKNGKQIGEVRGADAGGVQRLVSQA